jgi:hypothetical protein
VGTSGYFHPEFMRSKIKHNSNTLITRWREINMFFGSNWFIKLAQGCYLYSLNLVRPLPKNVKAYLVPRETRLGF